jgi:hypothetical protein
LNGIFGGANITIAVNSGMPADLTIGIGDQVPKGLEEAKGGIAQTPGGGHADAAYVAYTANGGGAITDGRLGGALAKVTTHELGHKLGLPDVSGANPMQHTMNNANIYSRFGWSFTPEQADALLKGCEAMRTKNNLFPGH